MKCWLGGRMLTNLLTSLYFVYLYRVLISKLTSNCSCGIFLYTRRVGVVLFAHVLLHTPPKIVVIMG